MIQRFLFRALRQGLELFVQDDGLYDELFAQLLGLEAKEVETVKKLFRQKMPTVEHLYAPKPAVMPAYCIEVGSEQQTAFMLSNSGGVGVYAVQGKVRPRAVFSTIWQHNYTVHCMSQSVHMTTYMYELAKAAIFFNTQYLQTQDCRELVLSGQGIGVDSREPEFIFSRALSFTCQREFRFFAKDDALRLNKVTGLHIAGGSGSDNGGVEAEIDMLPPAVSLPPRPVLGDDR